MLSQDLSQDTNCLKYRTYPKYKQFFDVGFSFFLLITLSPLLAIISILIKLDSKGPILFIQKRVGKDSEIFNIYKFRTMYIDSPNNLPTSEITEPGYYITGFGRFLRKSSIDELPQLWNILRGEMSFIGPRPVIPVETELIELRKSLYADQILPGVTGLSQVMGRDDLPINEKAYYDAQYFQNMSLVLDLKIILKTVRIIILSEHIRH